VFVLRARKTRREILKLYVAELSQTWYTCLKKNITLDEELLVGAWRLSYMAVVQS